MPLEKEQEGGVWLPGTKPLAPVVWRVEWPQEVKDALMTWETPKGTINNSDLEMVEELLEWLVLEASVPLRHEHVGLCSDNSATVSWQMRGASRRSAVANRLLRVLAIRTRKNRTSPLVHATLLARETTSETFHRDPLDTRRNVTLRRTKIFLLVLTKLLL